MRLIDADPLYKQTAEWEAQAYHMVDVTIHDLDKTEFRKWSAILADRSAFKFDVADAPTVDAVPVVRCKDCKHKGEFLCPWWKGEPIPDDWFCKGGERKDYEAD